MRRLYPAAGIRVALNRVLLDQAEEFLWSITGQA